MASAPNLPETIVVGCGVSGLSCGIRLLEHGFPVTIYARELPPHTTSDVAGAIWYPYRAYPLERVLQWGRATLDEFYRLMSVPVSGVRPIAFLEVFEQPTPDPWWKDVVRRFRGAAPDELPPGYRDGYVMEIPLVETPTYMPYLLARLQQLGGRIEQRTVALLSDLYGDNRLIVNCAGVGAKALTGDPDLYPIRGQLMRVRAPTITRGVMDEAGRLALAYVIPRSQDCVLGATTDDARWDRDVDLRASEDILQRCRQLDPALANADVLGHGVGLRPGRKAVRLEIEHISDTCALIHNYGHGGAGFTLSWGCADEVAQLARSQFAA
jgi:D-amino-acid oxidase